MARPLRSALLVPLVCGLSCVAPLKEPPALGELAGQSSAASSGALLELAEREFASRTLGGVRKAAALWTEAADADPEEVQALTRATRARVWLADREEDPAVREVEATQAVQTAQWCERRAPDFLPCVYWMAIALGVQARERKATGRAALPLIVERLARVIESEPELDHAGPHRVLALVYLRAPGWPVGPGDPDLGLEHARQAVDLAPDFPPNQLALAEAVEATEGAKTASKVYERALDLARQRLAAGEPDADRWIEEADRGLGR